LWRLPYTEVLVCHKQRVEVFHSNLFIERSWVPFPCWVSLFLTGFTSRGQNSEPSNENVLSTPFNPNSRKDLSESSTHVVILCPSAIRVGPNRDLEISESEEDLREFGPCQKPKSRFLWKNLRGCPLEAMSQVVPEGLVNRVNILCWQHSG
jgi:hypothetical protein